MGIRLKIMNKLGECRETTGPCYFVDRWPLVNKMDAGKYDCADYRCNSPVHVALEKIEKHSSEQGFLYYSNKNGST